MKHETHLNWIAGLIVIIVLICGTLIWINYNSWTVRFKMDDNTKKAIESLEWDKIYNENKCFSERCYFDIEENQIGGCSMYKVDCKEFEVKYGNEEVLIKEKDDTK
ncbi:MAG TPA: hypothetical protein ENG87_01775 [Candidatus Pacearchaeota archaeon]|nr:hypothetical protein [Candidatus Pacearchaeota archaeon]HDZ60481.1 hypothetical protein [Candidatus Pacearchaeota archaeon]